jgi:hypothetical protein
MAQNPKRPTVNLSTTTREDDAHFFFFFMFGLGESAVKHPLNPPLEELAAVSSENATSTNGIEIFRVCSTPRMEKHEKKITQIPSTGHTFHTFLSTCHSVSQICTPGALPSHDKPPASPALLLPLLLLLLLLLRGAGWQVARRRRRRKEIKTDQDGRRSR